MRAAGLYLREDIRKVLFSETPAVTPILYSCEGFAYSKCTNSEETVIMNSPLTFFIMIAIVTPVAGISGAAVVLDDPSVLFPADSAMTLLEDSSASLSIDQIIRDTIGSQFRPAQQAIPNLGFTRSAIWLKIPVIFADRAENEWVIDVRMPSLHHIDMYAVRGDSILASGKAGFLADNSERATTFRHPSFLLPRGMQSCTFFIRVQSESPIVLPVFLREKTRYSDWDQKLEFLLGLYFGALLIMAIYHLGLFAAVRDRGYLLLILAIVLFGFGQLTAVYGYLTDWGVRGIERFLPFLHIVNFGVVYVSLAICRYMLSRKNAPVCDRIIAGLQYAGLALMGISPFLDYMTAEKLLMAFNLIPLPFIYYAGIVACIKKNRTGQYYILAVSIFTFGLVLYNLMYGFGFFPYSTFIYFVPNVSFVVMLTLFSFGIGHRINVAIHDRDRAQQTSIRSLEKELHIRKEKEAIELELIQSRKMEAIGRCISGIAHDMRNYVSPIAAHARLLRVYARGNPKMLENAKLLCEAADPLNELANALLDISRASPKNMTLVDLNAVALRIASLIKHSAPRDVNVNTSICRTALHTMGDKGMIHSALLNIGINAMDAIRGDGHIHIQTGFREMHHSDTVRQQFNLALGTYATVTVCDNGAGIGEEALAHIFEPFFTSKGNSGGTGLGLARVYNCAKIHKGGIEVKSRTGYGTKITVYFPCARIHSDAPASSTDSGVQSQLVAGPYE
jgi:signal transduction histidine kinase